MDPLRRRVLLLVTAIAAGPAGAQGSRAARWLTITVREDPPQSPRSAQTAPHGAVTLDTRSAAVANSSDNSSVVATRASEQVLRAREGAPVPIRMQSAIPMTFRHFVAGSGGVDEIRGTVTYDAMVQFIAVTRVSGRVVTLDIRPDDSSLVTEERERDRMSIKAQGGLGEWIPVGGADLRADSDAPSNASTLRAQTRPMTNQRGVWLKVDLEPATRR